MSALRVTSIVIASLLMIPAGIGLLACTMCAFSSGLNSSDRFTSSDRIAFVIGAVICLGILAGGAFVIAKLGKKQAGS
jgi:hypothetical protein